MNKTIKNLILPSKNRIELKWQNEDKEVIWMFLIIEKSLITKNYEDNNVVSQPICRFYKNSEYGKTIQKLYDINFNEITVFIN